MFYGMDKVLQIGKRNTKKKNELPNRFYLFKI